MLRTSCSEHSVIWRASKYALDLSCAKLIGHYCGVSSLGRRSVSSVPVAVVFREDDLDLENPLHNEVLRAEQLEVLTQLGRCRYGETAAKVLALFHETRSAAEQKQISREVFQEKITWLVYIVGALIGGHWTGRVPMACGEGKREGRCVDGGAPAGHALVISV